MPVNSVIAVQVNERDNVATIFADVEKGTLVTITSQSGIKIEIVAEDAIPYGHKIAVKDFEPGETIIKYGEAIGVASKDIGPGEHVHVHNLESARGRGDWKRLEESV